MKVTGLPEWFWVVTVPTPDSTVADICFRRNLTQFAQQIRGGLDEATIVGIFAEKSDAQNEALRLLAELWGAD